MKSLKARGALIVEYALLLAVCCFLGVIYLDAAPGVRDGVGDIKTKTEKVLSDANDKTKGDKPGEEGNKPNLPEWNESYSYYTDANKTGTMQSLGEYAINAFFTTASNNASTNEIRNYLNTDGRRNVESIVWDTSGNVELSFNDGHENIKISNVNYNDGDFKNMLNNRGVDPSKGGTLVFNDKNQIVQSNNKGQYTYFEVGGPNGTTTPVGYKP